STRRAATPPALRSWCTPRRQARTRITPASAIPQNTAASPGSPSVELKAAGADQAAAAGAERPLPRPGQLLPVNVVQAHLLQVIGELQTGYRGRQRLRGRPHEVWRDQDHQLALVVLELVRAEQRAEDRNITDPRNLRDLLVSGVLQQPGERKALAAGQV